MRGIKMGIELWRFCGSGCVVGQCPCQGLSGFGVKGSFWGSRETRLISGCDDLFLVVATGTSGRRAGEIMWRERMR